MIQRKKFINFVLEEGKRARGIIAIGEIVLSENLYRIIALMGKRKK